MAEGSQTYRKPCGKRRNSSLRAISPFPTVSFKILVLQTRKNQGLFGKGLKELKKNVKSYNVSKFFCRGR